MKLCLCRLFRPLNNTNHFLLLPVVVSAAFPSDIRIQFGLYCFELCLFVCLFVWLFVWLVGWFGCFELCLFVCALICCRRFGAESVPAAVIARLSLAPNRFNDFNDSAVGEYWSVSRAYAIMESWEEVVRAYAASVNIKVVMAKLAQIEPQFVSRMEILVETLVNHLDFVLIYWSLTNLFAQPNQTSMDAVSIVCSFQNW